MKIILATIALALLAGGISAHKEDKVYESGTVTINTFIQTVTKTDTIVCSQSNQDEANCSPATVSRDGVVVYTILKADGTTVALSHVAFSPDVLAPLGHTSCPCVVKSRTEHKWGAGDIYVILMENGKESKYYVPWQPKPAQEKQGQGLAK